MKQILTLAASAVALAGCATMNSGPVAGPATAGNEKTAPDTMRWLYGSGEAAAASIQTWRQIADYSIAVVRQRKAPQSVPMGLPDGTTGGIGTPS